MKPEKLETETDAEYAARLKVWQDAEDKAKADADEAAKLKDEEQWLTRTKDLREALEKAQARLDAVEGRKDQSEEVKALTTKIEAMEAKLTAAEEALTKVRRRSRVEKPLPKSDNINHVQQKPKRTKSAWV